MCNVNYKYVDQLMSFGNGGPRMAQGTGSHGPENPPWLRLCESSVSSTAVRHRASPKEISLDGHF